jgi:hypothetical protein
MRYVIERLHVQTVPSSVRTWPSTASPPVLATAFAEEHTPCQSV